ncbi:MAG: hypothetical protein HFI31_03865 [Lachnospiraceae bacterium]|nr:hypothetical protein [Lachnospiraceae bacterium]MCI9133318.1 hypothetical protein [Lachnospiraceae bacterium]
MDDFLRKLLYRRFEVGRFQVTVLDLLLAVCITGTGVMLRKSVMEYTPVTLLKWIRMGLDFVMAGLGAGYIALRTESKNKTILTYALLVIWPVFIANSALWGKSGVYSGIILILGLLAWERGMKLVGLEAVAAAVFLTALELPGAEEGSLLTLGWPNFFELTGKTMFVDLYSKVAWMLILGFLCCGIYVMWKGNVRPGREIFLPILLFLAILVPYLAPFMPAWAGYGADVLAVLFAVTAPEKFYVPMLHVVVSYSAYAFALNGESKLPMAVYSVILLVLLLDVGAYVYRLVAEQAEERLDSWQQM